MATNAAMKSIVRRDTGESWSQYIRRLAEAEGIKNPTEEDARRVDRHRRGKRVSNQDWASTSDPDSRITKMKDGRTRLAHKAEHVIDLESEVIVAAQIYAGDAADGTTLVASEGYHAAAALANCAGWGLRTYISERRERARRRWTDKPVTWELAFRANSRRVRGRRTRALQRLRSERVERSFAHTCGSGQRRTWLCGVENVQKRYLLTAAALGLLMRHRFGSARRAACRGRRPSWSRSVASCSNRCRPSCTPVEGDGRGWPHR